MRNIAFDPQVERDRAAWLVALLDSVGGPALWMEDILDALPVTNDRHDALQLAQLLELLAQRGDDRARAVLEHERRLARFGPVDEGGIDWTLGPWPIPSADESRRRAPPSSDLPPPSLTELETVLDVLVRTRDPADRRRLIHPLLRARELPYTPRVVALLEHDDAAIRSSASLLVERMKDPRMREEGLRWMRAGGFQGPTTSLLTRNLGPDDVALLESFLPALDDPYAVHDACAAIASLSSHVPHSSWCRLCLWAYEWSPCSHCRSEVVERLDEMGSVPDELRLEWCFDVDESTREHGGRSNANG